MISFFLLSFQFTPKLTKQIKKKKVQDLVKHTIDEARRELSEEEEEVENVLETQNGKDIFSKNHANNNDIESSGCIASVLNQSNIELGKKTEEKLQLYFIFFTFIVFTNKQNK